MFPIPFKRLLFQQCEGTDHKELITQLLIMVCVRMCSCTGVFVFVSKLRKMKERKVERGKKEGKRFDVCVNKKIHCHYTPHIFNAVCSVMINSFYGGIHFIDDL